MNGPDQRDVPDLDGSHDPEVWAAAHLAGDLAAQQRERFEAHLLGCEACWAEVGAVRDGRAWAEGVREPAPQALREYLRALATAPPEPGSGPALAAEGISGFAADRVRPGPAGWNRRSWLSTAAALVAGAVLAGGLTLSLLSSSDGASEESLAAAAAAYRGEAGNLDRIDRPPAPRLGSLRWQGTTRADLAGRPATVYRYRDATGRQLLLVSSPLQFPRAKNAQTVLGSSWTAQIDGTVMFCVDHGGLSWLVVGESREQTIEAGRQAGLA